MVIGFEINANSVSTLHYGGNSFSSYAVPISSRPFFGNVLNARVASRFQPFHYRRLNFVPLSASLNGASNGGLISDALLPKDLEFKPSFDEYLKAMESSRTFRSKKDASSSTTTQKQKMREKGEEGNKKSKRVGEKIDGKDGFEAAKVDGALKVGERVMHKEGSSTGDITVRGRKNKGFKNEYDGKESKFDVKVLKQKHGANVREDRWLKRQSHSLEPESKFDVKTKQKHGANVREDGWMKRRSHSLEPESKFDVKTKQKDGSNVREDGWMKRRSHSLEPESKFDVKTKQKHGANVREDEWLKRRSHSFEPESKFDVKTKQKDGSNVREDGWMKHWSHSLEPESKFDVKANQKNGAIVREDGWMKHRSHSLEPESDNCSVVNSQSRRGRGRISNNITRSNLNNSPGSIIESSGEKVVRSRQRDYNTQQGKAPGGNKIVASNKVTDRGIGRRNTEIESVIHRNGQENVKLNRSSKHFLDRGHDSDNLKVERAAFMNFEDAIIGKQQFSHKEMEERIQKLARLLNGADIDLPEWMFSKTMRSAKIKFNDYSITRVIISLGNLGNWRRVIQVIEWLQRRERFKSHKLRHIYTAALDALRKSRRPVEALNVFHAMQQQMSSYPDLVAYHSIAVTLGQAGHIKELFDVIDIMRSPPKKKFKTGPFENWDPRLEPDTVVYDAVLNACVKRKQWEGAFWVLQQLKKQGQQPSATTYGLVMEVMFSCGKYNLVHEFFRKIQKSYIPNSLTYRVLVNTLWKEGKTDEAVLAVQEMERRGIVGSASLYYDLARCLCATGRVHEALMQIDKICKVANKPLVVTFTGLMQASLDSGNIQDGAIIFEKMKKICAPNLVTCNILLKAYLEHGMFEEAKELFEQMSKNTNHLRGITDYKMLVIPDIYTFNTILDACVAEKRWDYFDSVYQRMLYSGYHFNAKRHLRMVLEASRAGKEGPLEITWKHITDTGCVPPASLIKEMFCLKLEKDDYVSALTCITKNTPKDLQQFSKSSWLNLFKENSQLFQKDKLVRLMNEASNTVSNSSLPNPILVYLMQSCKEILCATDLSVADMDSVKTVFAVESKLVANSR